MWNRLAAMTILSFVAMYALMYVMVDTFDDVYANLNQLYMVLAMTAAMMIIEVATMRDMYDKKTSIGVICVSAIILVISVVSVRGQIAISDKEFLRSMIPHHGSAILMCEKGDIRDPEIKKLCESITSGQQEQIDWMKAKLSDLK
jgi:hypothetical protein